MVTPSQPNDRTKNRAAESGFTLVEVLVASFILATALLALSTLFALGLKNNAVAKEDTVMAALAQQQLEALRRMSGADLERLFPVDPAVTPTWSCQGPCASGVIGSDVGAGECDDNGNGWDPAIVPSATRLCYPIGCAYGTAGSIVVRTENPVVDPNKRDRVREGMYVRTWTLQKVNLGDPVGCVFKVSVTVGSRNGLFAPPPTTDVSWLRADSQEVVGDRNPRRVTVSAFRR